MPPYTPPGWTSIFTGVNPGKHGIFDFSARRQSSYEVEFINAGHLLGSGYARIRTNGKTILFGGDLGRYGRPVLPDPTTVQEADFLLVESTYGNRRHAKVDPAEALASAIEATVARGGTVVIPAFAVGRAQTLLFHLQNLKAAGRLSNIPVFLDSPMATEALAPQATSARAQRRMAQADYQRMQSLFAEGAVAQRDVETAELALRNAEAAEAAAVKRLDDATIRAPVTGVIAARFHESGDRVKDGDALFRLQDRKEADFCLGPTHEEVITDVVRRDVKSYRQLPIHLYQLSL